MRRTVADPRLPCLPPLPPSLLSSRRRGGRWELSRGQAVARDACPRWCRPQVVGSPAAAARWTALAGLSPRSPPSCERTGRGQTHCDTRPTRHRAASGRPHPQHSTRVSARPPVSLSVAAVQAAQPFAVGPHAPPPPAPSPKPVKVPAPTSLPPGADKTPEAQAPAQDEAARTDIDPSVSSEPLARRRLQVLPASPLTLDGTPARHARGR